MTLEVVHRHEKLAPMATISGAGFWGVCQGPFACFNCPTFSANIAHVRHGTVTHKRKPLCPRITLPPLQYSSNIYQLGRVLYIRKYSNWVSKSVNSYTAPQKKSWTPRRQSDTYFWQTPKCNHPPNATQLATCYTHTNTCHPVDTSSAARQIFKQYQPYKSS